VTLAPLSGARAVGPRRDLTTDLEADLIEIVNGRTGTVRAKGRLTEQGADLLRGTLEQLARQGHTTVLLDLAEVDEPDGTGASVLRDLRSSVAASGGRLRGVRAPGWVPAAWDERGASRASAGLA
jgi:anti-anti-sigma regulatory factor